MCYLEVALTNLLNNDNSTNEIGNFFLFFSCLHSAYYSRILFFNHNLYVTSTFLISMSNPALVFIIQALLFQYLCVNLL